MVYSDQRSRVLGCVLLPLLGLAVVSVQLMWLVGGPYTTTFPRQFESTKWKAAKPSAYPDDDTRCGMVADLRLRVGVEGRTRSELFELLGAPVDVPGEPARNYWLLCPSFLDIWVLNVRWENDPVVEVSVHDN